MKFIQSKKLLFLLLFTHVISPMKPFPMMKSVFHEVERSALPVLLTLENYTSLGILAFQAASFVWLKKNNSLFGTELISQKIDTSGYPFAIRPRNALVLGVSLGFFFTALSSRVNMLPQECIHSDTIIDTLLLASSIIHTSNLIYDNALELLKNDLKPELILKQNLDVSTLPDKQCLICFDDECSCGYVNLCDKKGHIFCKSCSVSCFNESRKKPDFANKYWCEFCRSDVPCDDEKFEINLPPKPKVTLELWLKQMGPMAIIYCVSLYVFTNLMLCQFS